MGVREVAVLGGSVAGMSTALLLARDGHFVTLFERDRLQAGEPLGAMAWERRGIAHFMQPQALFHEIARKPRPAAGPNRDDMMSLTAAAAGAPASNRRVDHARPPACAPRHARP